MGEAGKDTYAETASTLHRHGAVLQGGIGFIVGTLTHHVGQHGRIAPTQHRVCLALQHGKESFRAAHCRTVHIDMRIGVIAGQYIAVADHRFGNVGVHVQGYGDG